MFREREGGSHLETTSQRVAYVADLRDNNLNLTCHSRLVGFRLFWGQIDEIGDRNNLMAKFLPVMLYENKNFLAFLAHISHIPYFYRIYFKTPFPHRQQSVGGLRFTGERRLTLKVSSSSASPHLTQHMLCNICFALSWWLYII